MSDSEEEISDLSPERPLPCSECRKPVVVYYTEIVGGNFTHTAMCADCPEYAKMLKGEKAYEEGFEETGKSASLACGNCGTTLASIKVGHPLGCAHCYEVFDTLLVQELLSAKRIPERVAKNRKHPMLHYGRSPGETHPVSPSLRLIALNEALGETLKREDYEQAALLRDEIQRVTEQTEKETP